jgi:phosphate transport system permease protein
MTDTTASSDGLAIRRPDLSPARVRRRYASETRFKLYGRLAIAAAVAMLGILLVSIVSKGYSAFMQTMIAVEVTLDPAEFEVERNSDGEVVDVDGDFRGVMNDALYALFPHVEGRTERRALRGLVTNDAAFELQARVDDDPDLIGKTVLVEITSSDDIDVYNKGRVTDIARYDVSGVATPTGTTGEIEILTGANDFARIVTEVKARLGEIAAERADTAEAAALAARNAEESLTATRRALEQAEAAGDAERVARLQEEADGQAAQVESLRRDSETAAAEAEELRARSQGAGGMEALSDRLPSYLIEINGGLVKLTQAGPERALGEVLVPLTSADSAQPGDWSLTSYLVPESDRRVKDYEIAWVESLRERGQVDLVFNTSFFTEADSREPEQAGIWGAAVGSFLTLTVTLLLAFPVAVLAAVYLEEFAPKNKVTDLIEVNINNLAAVPSIVFGLLGLAMFLNFFGLPRSAPLVGGMVLALMTLPTIIIAARAALKAVPPSIREAALGVGASKLQTVTHHVLPLAMPGILTGTIIGMAQALGETAPLLMIGMVAFIADVPGGFTDAATVLPVQIYLWADSPERAFVAKTSAAIMVLLAFLIFMNAMAVVLRKRFERRW